jgi:GT2 family glycosyltransferase/glycosyltransferase involved in cell wall biosynthesis
VQALTTQVVEKEQTVQALTTQVVEKEQTVQALTTQVVEKEQTVQALTTQVVEQQRDIQNSRAKFQQKEKELQNALDFHMEITNSTAWGLVIHMWQIRLWIIPHGSLREQVFSKIKKLFFKIKTALVTRVSLHIQKVRSAIRFFKNQEEIFYFLGKIKNKIKLAFLRKTRRNYSKSLGVTKKTDIICFSIIDWDFRFQRPQQILNLFNTDGHRVFYLNTHFSGPEALEVTTLLIKENIWEIILPGVKNISIYQDEFTSTAIKQVEISLCNFLQKQNIVEAICLVHHPFWTPLVQILKNRYGWKVIYDCMDEHSGFVTTNKNIDLIENDLALLSNLVTTTSNSLYQKLRSRNANSFLMPNAGDYTHFSQTIPRDKSPLVKFYHPVIGYYGAIAEWFDTESVHQAIISHPEWSFVLIGHTFGSDIEKIKILPNVYLLGEKTYAELPNYTAGFDVCIIPFQNTPLTKATNPVKVYEYLSTGKPIVARNLPELTSLSDVVYLYNTPDEFVNMLEQAILEDSDERQGQRQTVARNNTWEMRYQFIKSEIESLYDKVSIIIVTWNNLEFTKKCIHSILADQTWPNYEIIIIDNASNDGTVEYLRSLSEHEECIKVVFNKKNIGFAAANNIGLQEIQDSKFVVLLNNDTIVSLGWLSRLLRYIEQHEIGMVGPVTNFAGNEAKIDIPYVDINNIDAFASEIAKENFGQNFDIPMLAMYCVALRKEVFDLVGPLDERFGIGMFEDDDYSERVRLAGYRVVCAEDVFIHHYGRVSFDKLSKIEYIKLFELNRGLFEEKWKKKWKQHQYRMQL